MGRATGIDVSHFQGNIDWQTVAEQQDFAFIKATEGAAYTDPTFHSNRAGAHAAGLVVGIYHFGRPGTSPTVAADYFIDACGQIRDHEIVALDLETTDGLDSRAVRVWAKAWLDHVHDKTGHKPILYTYPSFIEEHLHDHLTAYPLWIASYRSTPDFTGWHDWLFWQSTSDGRVHGIGGRVDCDEFNGTRDELHKWVGIDPPTPKPKPTPKPAPRPAPTPAPGPVPAPVPNPKPKPVRRQWWQRFLHWL